MSRLNELVSKIADGYQRAFIVAAVFAFVAVLLSGNPIAIVFLPMLLVIGYFGGLWLIGLILAWFIDPKQLSTVLQSRRIRSLNERIAAGVLIPGTTEFDDAVQHAGLDPISTIVETGPIFGRQFDTDLHEWIDARRSAPSVAGEGPILRYNFVGPARFDEDNLVIVEHRDNFHFYIVLNGFLYEHTSNPPETGPHSPQ